MNSRYRGAQPPDSGLPRRITTAPRPGGITRWLRTIAGYFVVFYAIIWVMNIFGVSTVFNSPDIYYSGIDANTGQRVVVHGCRPERLLPDGSCNKTIDLATVVEAMPRWSR